MKTKQFLLIFFVINFKIIFSQSWVQKASSPDGRREANCFVVGQKAYVGMGLGQSGKMHDWWEYNPVTDKWTAKASFPSLGAPTGISFGVGNKGYFLTLRCLSSPGLCQDIYEYDPQNDTWTKKSQFPGLSRNDAVCFVIGHHVYIGLGWSYDNNKILNDIWRYTPSLDQWVQMSDFVGQAREKSIGFSSSSKGYVGLGKYLVGGNTAYLTDLWEYDPIFDTWSQKANFPGKPRDLTISFGGNSKGYVGTGSCYISQFNAGYLDDFYEYDPMLDSWTTLNYMPHRRDQGIGFLINDKLYAGLGYFGIGIATDDLWEYTLPVGLNEANLTQKNIPVFMSQDDKFISINLIEFKENEHCLFKIYDIMGKELKSVELSTGEKMEIFLGFEKGLYIYTIQHTEKNQVIQTGKVVVR